MTRARRRATTTSCAGWKVYCPWGDVPNASGWFLDSPEIGIPFLAQIQHLHDKYGTPAVLASHKGFALPGFDQRGGHAPSTSARRPRPSPASSSSSTTRATTPASPRVPTPAPTTCPPDAALGRRLHRQPAPLAA